MVQFVIGEGYPTDLFVGCVWNEAFEMCSTILRLPACRKQFLSCASEDFQADAYDTGIEETYTVKLTTNVDDLNSYANVNPTEALSVNFNPILVLNIYKEFAPRPKPPIATGSSEKSGGEPVSTQSAESSAGKRKATGTGVPSSAAKVAKTEAQVSDPFAIPQHDRDARRRQVVLFLAVKLAHEVWHLVHRKGSEEVERTNASPERYRQDLVEGKTYTVTYTDIGMLMERDVLGGVWEFTSVDRKNFMTLDAVVIYPSVRSTLGAFLNPASSSIDANGIDVQTMGQHRSKAAPKFKSGQSRLSTAQGIEGDEGEDEEEGRPQPGTGGRDIHGKPLSKCIGGSSKRQDKMSADYYTVVGKEYNAPSMVPTKQPMTLSNTCYVSSVRTTLCDIMCTVNASVLIKIPPPSDKLRDITATLPGNRSGQKSIKKKVKNATLFQNLILSENQRRVDYDLKSDRDAFFYQLKKEKMMSEAKRNAAAVKLQALFRGFRKRRRPTSYIRNKKRKRVHTQNDMQDELCTLAATLGLKPIDGLSLESRSKTSRRKERIMVAAAFRLHRFFDMILQRSRARKRLMERREEILNWSARVITRAVRYVKVKKFVKRCENVKRQQMALKIQCCARIFQAREKVRVYSRMRHVRLKREEAAIIIQRNLAPKARAYNLARLTMVTMRQYGRIADEVVSFITDFLLEGGIRSVIDVFTRQISDKFEVVFPKAEDRIFNNLIDEAVMVETHIWLEEQMLAILMENQRIGEDKMRQEAENGPSDGNSVVSWDNLPPEFYAAMSVDFIDSPLGQAIAASVPVSTIPSRDGSAAVSRVGTPPLSGKLPLVAPSVHNRNHFINLRGSIGGSNSLHHHGGSFSAGSGIGMGSFSISPQHYRNVMMRLSSIDMNHSMKYQAALAAANLAANGSFDGGSPTQPNIGQLHSLSETGDMCMDEEDGESTKQVVRFIDNDVWQDAEPSERVNEMLPTSAVLGIAECDEEEEEEAEPTTPSEKEFHDHGGKGKRSSFAADSEDQNESDGRDAASTEDPSQAQSSEDPSQMQLVRQRTTSDFAEAFASMSITSVLNQFSDSLVMGDDGTAGEVSTIPGVAMVDDAGPSEQNQWASEPVSGEFYADSEDGDAPSDIGSAYYDASVAGSIATIDAVRHIEEWEVCRDFISMSLTEKEKREIDQLFKDAMHYFHKARFQRASDVLENFLPILQKFPSSDPFHPDVARVQTTIKTIKARILFEQAQYADAKEVFDDALQHRIEVFGKAHYLCVELYYFIGEWHRSQAEYDNAEKYLNQASLSVAALIKIQQDVKLWHAKNKVLVAQAEMLRQSGQYYRANQVLRQVQESLTQFSYEDAESVRIQEAYTCSWISALVIHGKISQAIALHQELLDKRRFRYGTKHPKIATSMCALGSLKLLRSEFNEASDLLEDSLAMRREIYLPDHPAIAASLYAKGMAFLKMGRFPEAASDMTYSLEMRRMKFGSEHPTVGKSASGLAIIQTQMGDPLRAWKNHNFALTVFRTRYALEKHCDIADCLFHMGCNAESRGSYVEATAYHEQTLELRESIMELFRIEGSGPNDLILSIELSRVHLARVYSQVSRLNDAKTIMKDAVKNVTKVLGNRNDLVAHSLSSLGELCRIRGNYADAKQLYALSFNITQELFGDDHPMIATIMLQSSENLRAPGMYSEAIELEKSAYDVRSYIFGSDNIFTAMAIHQRGQLLRDSGKLSDADKQYVRAMHILLARLGENSGMYGLVLGDYAECCRLAGKLEMSEKHFKRAIDIQKASYGEQSLQITETIGNFTLLLMDMHHPADAAQILRDRVVPTLDQLLGKSHPTAMYAKANLALAVQFVRFFQSQGTEEGSIVLENVLNHPDITTFLDACKASSFAPDHPWLLRFTEGSQSFAGDVASGSHGSQHTPVGGSLHDDNSSINSSVSISASLGPSIEPSAGPPSLEGTNSVSYGDPSSFTPREAGSSGRPPLQQSSLGAFSPSDSDSYSVQSYGDHTYYTQSDATGSYAGSLAGSMTYSASNNSGASYSQSQSQSQSQSRSQSQSQSYVPAPDGSVSNSLPPQTSLTEQESGTYLSVSIEGTGMTGSQSGSYPSGSGPSGQFPGSYQSSAYQSAPYVSQHSAVLEYNDDYSASSASASMTASLSPRGYRHRRNFSVTPSSSIVSRPLINYEESTIGSWEYGEEQVSLDEYFSRSYTLDDESSMHTMESNSLYHEHE